MLHILSAMEAVLDRHGGVMDWSQFEKEVYDCLSYMPDGIGCPSGLNELSYGFITSRYASDTVCFSPRAQFYKKLGWKLTDVVEFEELSGEQKVKALEKVLKSQIYLK